MGFILFGWESDDDRHILPRYKLQKMLGLESR